MLKLTKTLLATGMIAASSYALAAGETFTVDPAFDTTNNALAGLTEFDANLLLGNYTEGVRVNGGLVGGTFVPDGTFDASIIVNLNEFALNDGITSSTLSATQTGLSVLGNYQLYATIMVSGDLVFGSGGAVQGFANFGGSLELFMDQDKDTDLNNFGTAFDNTGAGAIGINLAGDDSTDIKLGEALMVGGNTNFGTTSSSFNLTSESFELTSSGENFFVKPNPFYVEFFSSGNITGLLAAINDGAIGPDGLYNFTSGVEIEFRVPEPSALAFLGLGLIGAGFMSRRRKS
jgi:hypothetical protein